MAAPTAWAKCRRCGKSRVSWTLAAEGTAPSGMPSVATTMWCLVPALPRSVGLGPVSSPPRLARTEQLSTTTSQAAAPGPARTIRTRATRTRRSRAVALHSSRRRRRVEPQARPAAARSSRHCTPSRTKERSVPTTSTVGRGGRPVRYGRPPIRSMIPATSSVALDAMLASPCRRHGKRAPGAPDADRPTSYAVLETAPNARSTDPLCEWLRELASIMVAEPPLELAAGELACRLDHRAFAVQPLGLDRVEPRALARQPADQEAAAAAGLLDRAIARPDPVPHLAADVPGGVVPDQDQHPDAVGREVLGDPGEEGAGHRADRPPVDEAQQHPLVRGQPQAVAGEGLGVGVGAVGGVQAEAQALTRRPGVQRRLRQAREPDLVGEAERPARPAARQPDQAVAATFLRASAGSGLVS